MCVGSFGWVDRRRLLWGSGPQGFTIAESKLSLPEGASLQWPRGVLELQWGGKAIPGKLRLADGAKLTSEDLAKVAQQMGVGAMPPFFT